MSKLLYTELASFAVHLLKIIKMKRIISQRGRISLPVILTALFLALLPAILSAQQAIRGEVSKLYQVVLNDGSTIAGRLTEINDREIVLQSATLGEVRLQKEKIKTMTVVSAIDEKKGELWFPNPNPSRYILGNSAIPMEKGSGYYQNTWIFINSFSYAFTKNISVSGGFEILSILAGGDGPYAFFINPRVSFELADNFYAGGNILYANTIKTVEEFSGLATLNAFATYGNRNNNLTLAVGWGWAEGEFSARPVFSVSGMTRVSKRIGFITENWLIPGIGDNGGYYGLFSYGIRFLGEKTSIDLAFVNNKDIAKGIIIGIPWLDFVISF